MASDIAEGESKHQAHRCADQEEENGALSTQDLSNSSSSPDTKSSAAEDEVLSASSNILVRPGEGDLKLNDQSTDKDTFEDKQETISLSDRIPHEKHSSEQSESENKILEKPRTVVGGKIYTFDMGNEDFFPDFELPHDTYDPRTDDIINDIIQNLRRASAAFLDDVEFEDYEDFGHYSDSDEDDAEPTATTHQKFS